MILLQEGMTIHPRMKLVEYLGAITSSSQHQFLLSTRVVLHIPWDVVNLPIKHSPTILLGVMLPNLLFSYASLLYLGSGEGHVGCLCSLDGEFLPGGHFAGRQFRNNKWRVVLRRFLLGGLVRLIGLAAHHRFKHILNGHIINLGDF